MARLRPPAPARYVLPIEALRPQVRWAARSAPWLSIPERVISDHELVLILAGGGPFITPAGTITLSHRSLLIIPPGLPHAFQCRPVTEHVAIHCDLAPGIPPSRPGPRPPYTVALGPGLALPLHRTLPASDPLLPLLADIPARWRGADAATRLAMSAVLALTLARLAEPQGDGSSALPGALPVEDTAIRAALARLDADLAEPLSLADCARACALTPTRLAHRFRAHTGMSPMAYRRQRRIDAARRLLADTDLAIQEVAAQCGFPDPFHFSRVFRALDGLSPAQFRSLARTSPPR